MLDAYARAGAQVDADLLARRDWHWECREITGITTALRTGDTAEIEDGIRKVLNGPAMASKRTR